MISFNASSAPGTAVTSTPIPPVTARINAPMPTAVPATWRTVRPNPNRIPEARSSELFGPGVIEPTNANPTSPSSSFIMTAVDDGGQGAVLYDLCM